MQGRKNTIVSGFVRRNVQTLDQMRQALDRRRGLEDRVADAITAFAGSMRSVYAHAALLALWLLINLRWIPWIPAWDPYPFVMLAAVASIEAIFLSTFLLISQNRMQKLVDRRANLDLQVSLLTEHELTRLIHLTDAIAKKLDVETSALTDLDELKRDVSPEKVLAEIERTEGS